MLIILFDQVSSKVYIQNDKNESSDELRGSVLNAFWLYESRFHLRYYL